MQSSPGTVPEITIIASCKERASGAGSFLESVFVKDMCFKLVFKCLVKEFDKLGRTKEVFGAGVS